jgi:hypothetical protein
MDDAMKNHPEADVLVNFASLRSAYESTMEALTFPQVNALNFKTYQDNWKQICGSHNLFPAW